MEIFFDDNMSVFYFQFFDIAFDQISSIQLSKSVSIWNLREACMREYDLPFLYKVYKFASQLHKQLDLHKINSKAMSNNERGFWLMYGKFKPHLFMVLVQVALVLLYFLVEISFKNGMNPHVFVTYRHAVGGIVVLPFAYFLER